MRRKCQVAILFGLLAALTATGFGQESLGDVARKSRERQKNKDTQVAHKVITDDDMPQRPESTSEATTSDGPATKTDERETSSVSGEGQSAEGWKTAILAQKNAVASLQSQVDALSNSIRFVQANLYVNGVQYNQYQQQKQQQLQVMQKHLDEEKKKLEAMQESARKAGFGNAVYDP